VELGADHKLPFSAMFVFSFHPINLGLTICTALANPCQAIQKAVRENLIATDPNQNAHEISEIHPPIQEPLRPRTIDSTRRRSAREPDECSPARRTVQSSFVGHDQPGADLAAHPLG
jgi:hypothetical protein